jgi:hypothetical protein
MSSIESAPASMPATSAATFADLFAAGTVERCSTRSTRPLRRASSTAGTRPAHDTRFGSSKRTDSAANLWQGCIYEMPFVPA